MNILWKQNLILNRQICNFCVFSTKGVGEREHRRVLIVVFLGWRVHEGQSKR